jgi:hypothetical protein
MEHQGCSEQEQWAQSVYQQQQQQDMKSNRPRQAPHRHCDGQTQPIAHQHAVYELGLAVKHVDSWVSDFAMDQQRHAQLCHGAQRRPHSCHVRHARVRVGRCTYMRMIR